MNTPVTYNVAAPASANVPPVEKKESGGVLGWLGSLFGGSETPSTNTATIGGRRRRTRKGKKSRKSSRRNRRK